MSNFTDSTMNRGVEAKEIEIANARLDLEASESPQWPGAGVRQSAGARQSAGDALPPSPAFTGSYLQVVVEKHKRQREQRLPAASSPAPGAGAAGDARPHGAVLLACPASLAYFLGGAEAAEAGAGAGEGGAAPAQPAKTHESWHIFRERESPPASLECDADGPASAHGAEPACVEVYRFERVGAWLASGAARPTRVGARAARAGRAARRAAAELGACARLAAGAPLRAGVLTLRCALHAARDAGAGALLAVSDYALKPALALAFNALLHPPLVFLANLLRGVREALRPAVELVAECAGAAAVLVRAARLVELHYTYAAPPPSPPRLLDQHPRRR